MRARTVAASVLRIYTSTDPAGTSPAAINICKSAVRFVGTMSR